MNLSPKQGNEESESIKPERRCWRCGQCALLLAISIIIVTCILSFITWVNSRAEIEAFKSHKMSPQFQQQIASHGVKIDKAVWQPLVIEELFDLVQRPNVCSAKNNAWAMRQMCSGLEHIPISVFIAKSLTEVNGQQTIYINQLAPWNDFFQPAYKENVSPSVLFSWALWHEFGHLYQIRDGKMISALFDPSATVLSALYRETHADIFAIVSMAKEPGANEKDMSALVAGIIKIRAANARYDFAHATNEYLPCIDIKNYFAKEDAMKVSMGLLEEAIISRAKGTCPRT